MENKSDVNQATISTARDAFFEFSIPNLSWQLMNILPSDYGLLIFIA